MKKFIYSKIFYFKGREYRQYIKVDGMNTMHCVSLRNIYEIEFAFTPYTWGIGVKITWRKDLKSLKIKLLPFSMAIMIEDEVTK